MEPPTLSNGITVQPDFQLGAPIYFADQLLGEGDNGLRAVVLTSVKQFLFEIVNVIFDADQQQQCIFVSVPSQYLR